MKAHSTFPATIITTPNEQQELRPLGWVQSLLYFGIPTLALLVSCHVFRPWLERQGYSPLSSYLAAVCVPLALMFAAALIGYHRVEGHPLNWQAFRARMRFPRLKGRDLLWGLGIFIVGMIGYGALSQVSLYLIDAGVMPLPENLPALVNPKLNFSLEALDQAAGFADARVLGKASHNETSVAKGKRMLFTFLVSLLLTETFLFFFISLNCQFNGDIDVSVNQIS